MSSSSLARAFRLSAVTAGCALSFAPASHGATFADGLKVYYNFDSGTVTTTTVTDQWTKDGSTDNVGRSALATTSSAKFGTALATTTSNATPRSVSTPATITGTFLPGVGDYSLSFWYNQSAAGNNRLWGAGARDNTSNYDDGMQIYSLVNGSLELAYHDPSLADTARATVSAAAGTTNFNGSNWHLVNVVRNTATDTISLWVNGAQVASAAIADSYNIAVNTALSGANETWNREAAFGPDATVAGSTVDDAGIWRRALSASEIAQIWNSGIGRPLSQLIPEPGVSSFLLLGLSGLATRRRRAR